jgi:hypothetical protein
LIKTPPFGKSKTEQITSIATRSISKGGMSITTESVICLIPLYLHLFTMIVLLHLWHSLGIECILLHQCRHHNPLLHAFELRLVCIQGMSHNCDM